jgi:hypothetical protein
VPKQKSFPLRIGEQDRRAGPTTGAEDGIVGNRLYLELIPEGLLMREQMAYFEKLITIGVPADEGLALLDLAPDVLPRANDSQRPK